MPFRCSCAALGFLLLVATSFLFESGCAPGRVSRPAGKEYPLSGKSYVINGKRYYLLASAEGYREKGVASWYGRDFHGRRTASGERYDMYGLTAAHKTLPLQTWVKVTNLANHREITVRVNDRGPFTRGRVIDLSYAAARRLGMAEAGTARVLIEALGRTEEREVDGRVRTVLVQPRSYQEGRFAVQVASLRHRDNAYALAERLGRRYGGASVEVFDRGDAVFYRVQVAEKHSLGQALELQDILEKEGFADCFVVAR
ncbi:MAG: septal ring lytic transglycosylase RlpA family protein [Thermodesulfobacteriota bacterium]